MEVSAGKPVDILVVDDNPAKLLAVQAALAPLGQNLVAATSGREALTKLLERDFATVVLDVNMPDVDGFETARLIRSRPRSAHTPIIFVSAVNMDEIDARRGYSLGAVDYIFAPIVPEVLRAKVAVFVELHRKTEEARKGARDLEQSQRQLRLAERMASIGALCAGLGHDMGNLLLPIMARLDALRPEDLPEHARENVDSIRSCVEYLRKLCSGLRLLALDPDHSVAGETTALDGWWAETSAIFRNALPRGVALEFQAEPDLPPVGMARHLLTQAVFNLVQNAGEALSAHDGGLVRIWAEPEMDASAVRIGVTDNGPGMDPDVLAHCIDPFFTTKSRGISTGLGLALVHGIVQREEGELRVESAPGKGATLSFSIPAGAIDAAARPLAIVALREPRAQSIAAGLVRVAGFEIAARLPPNGGPGAIWITDPGDHINGAAEAFTAGRPDRRILVCTEDESRAPRGAGAFTLSEGGGALRGHLAAFLRACARPQVAAAESTEGPAG
jgi:signal transduction histidine kinase